MTDFIKEPHTVIFIEQTGCGKIHLVLELIEKEYKKHFDFIFIIYPHSEKVLHITQRSGSKPMIMFGL